MSISVESLMRDSAVETAKPSVASELGSFLFVGGLGAVCYVGLSMLLIDLDTGLPAWLVGAACYAVLVLPVYLAHRHYSFRSEASHTVAFPRYLAVQINALVLAGVFSYLCYSVFSLSSGAGAIVVVALTSGVNFLILKLWAFAARD